MSTILLSNLTDYQKSLLTRLAYLNIDSQQFDEFKEKQSKITVSDLKSLIFDPDEPYLGVLHMQPLKRVLTGVTTSNLEFVEEMERAGLAELEIVDFADNRRSGFNGICFADSQNNIGFSFRGTDAKTLSSFATDGIADIEAFLTNNTIQVYQAQELFDKYQNRLGKNFLYGHSLGGFLAESIYLHNHENITNAFVVNPLHINSQLLDEKSKIAAFNNPIKFSCFVTGGDYVSSINEPVLFHNNVNYVRNSREIVNNPIGNHLIEAGEFDENGNFVECPKEEAFEGHSAEIMDSAIHVINDNRVKGFFSKAFLASKKWLSSIKQSLSNLFNRKKDSKKDDIESESQKVSSGLDKYVIPENQKPRINNKENAKPLAHAHSVPDHEHE